MNNLPEKKSKGQQSLSLYNPRQPQIKKSKSLDIQALLRTAQNIKQGDEDDIPRYEIIDGDVLCVTNLSVLDWNLNKIKVNPKSITKDGAIITVEAIYKREIVKCDPCHHWISKEFRITCFSCGALGCRWCKLKHEPTGKWYCPEHMPQDVCICSIRNTNKEIEDAKFTELPQQQLPPQSSQQQAE